ncbi:MAG: CHRD domain-containing protein [Acidobacteriota bacterium]|nr:CHRD domain-containing protein [Acidobacteriota bacterium]
MTRRNYFNLYFLSHFPVIRFAVLAILCLLSAPIAHANTVFTATLNGTQAVPPTSSSATGMGSVILSEFQSTVTVTLNLSNLQSSTFTARIHGPAARGANGEAIFTFPAGTSTQSFLITPEMAAGLRAGLWYFSVVTSNFPNGEIRGQLEPLCAPPPANMRNWFRAENSSKDWLNENIQAQGGSTWSGGIGKVGNTFSFNGSHQFINFGNFFDYKTFTLSTWVKPGATQVRYATLIDNNSNLTATANWRIAEHYDEPNKYYYGDAGGSLSFVLEPNVWQHLTVVRSENRISIYRNGVLQASGYFPIQVNYDGEQSLFIARSANRANHPQTYNWKGAIDELTVYDRPLADWEIANIYNSGSAGVCTESGATKRPSNGKIAFVRQSGNQQRIFTVNPDGTNLSVIAADADRHHYDPSFSPNGGKIAFTRNNEIYTMNPDGTGIADLVPSSNSLERYPRWSPNGNIIVFTKYGNNSSDIYRVNSDGTNLQKLTDSSTYFEKAVWSPNMSQFVYSGAVNGASSIFTMNTDGTSQIQITSGYSDRDPSWSPDGNKIVFDRNGEICLMNKNGTDIVNLTNTPYVFEGNPSYSPDGTKILFIRYQYDVHQIWEMNLDGSGQKSLVSDSSNYNPVWQPIPNPENLTPLPGTNVKVSFYNVTAPGRTVAIPLQSKQIPQLPARFVPVSPIYDIRTSATYIGTITVSFDVSSIPHATACSELRVMHFAFGGWGEGYYPPPVFNNGVCTVSHTVYSLSPFMVARFNTNPQTLSGTVKYGTTPEGQSDKLVSGVSLTATGASETTANTNSNGAYLLENLLGGEQYAVTATKSGNVNGITSFDATLVLRHVAAGGQGIFALSPNQQLAADTDNDKIVSAFDATQILRYVAANGRTSTAGRTGQWTLSPASRNYPALHASLENQDYTANLVGEVSGDWTAGANLAESNESAAIEISNETDATPIIDSANPKLGESLSEIGAPNIETKTSQFAGASKANENTILVPVILANDTGKSVSSYSFVVSFDPDLMQADFSKPFETNGTLSSGGNFTIVSDTNTPGRIGIAAVSLNGIAETSGTLLKLRFKILKTAKNSKENIDNLAILRNLRIEDENGGSIAYGKTNYSNWERALPRSK